MAYILDNNQQTVRVTIKDLFHYLLSVYRLSLQEAWEYWYDEDCESYEIPVRLQIVDGYWYLHIGDNQFDTDHRGVWGYGYLIKGMHQRDIRDLARDLISQAKEHGEQK